jgi:hypothetical protein
MIIKVHIKGSQKNQISGFCYKHCSQKTLKSQITAQKTMGSLSIPVMHVAKGVIWHKN